ncbi:mucin-2 isoform X1 [Cydia strobilella]|uniref:mucin-2 isoform X1 n=2 Tax=Cydia strobilella TaxID=1100964 RepID=UPI0030053188
MRRRWNGCEMTRAVLIFTLLAISASSCDGARRAQRRKDTARAELPSAAPSAETLTALAQAMGAAGFEHREGRTLVKRLIPADSQPDLDLVEHQGVIGKAGVDFPAYPSIPNTGFNCKNVPTGYYADLETDCQVFHICDTSRKISFLCPNGTIFSQSHLICDWWFKVNCASAPALYESSAEYYSNEQKKSQKITQSLSKNIDLQQIADNSARAESRRSSVNVPSTTERLQRHRQRLQTEAPKATARSFHAFFAEVNPTLKTETTTNIDKRRRNLVQLIANNFGNAPARTTLPTYTESSTYRSDKAAGDYNSLKEMQVAAETASFTNNKNRQYLQDAYNKNYRPYPVYTPNLPNHQPLKLSKPKSNPTLTTLYNFRDKTLNNQGAKEVTITTKRPTLLPYTKSYSTTFNDRREPYTRPGISSLKEFLERERNKTLAPSTTEKVSQVTDRSDQFTQNVENTVSIVPKNNFESVTKIPQTTRNQYYVEPASDRISTVNLNQITTEPSYQERRERLLKKLNLERFQPTEPTVPTTLTEKYYGDLPNRPGLLVPPSLTPKTLHTLAIYYATALDNLSTTASPEEASEASTPTYEDYGAMEDALPALFSQHTINKYSKLFGHGTETSELLEDIKLDPNGTYNELADDLAVQQSQNPLATSPQIRELAQVFTHALSAYLQDPVQFRKVLSDIRPTHPSFGDMLSTTEESYNTEPTTTVNEDDDEILGFSDDNKVRSPFVSLRDGKSLNIATDYPAVSDDAGTTPSTINTEFVSTTVQPTTPKSPFRCCGRISASYTTASTPFARNTTPFSFTNTVASNVNTLANDSTDYTVTTTEDNYLGQRYGGFQNNSNNSPYGKEVLQTNAKPLTEYVEVTNLPSAWGVEPSSRGVDATIAPIPDSDNIFESKKIRTTTGIPETTPVYFTEADSSIELENEEELQRAHSQSFVTPQNNLRQGKQINLEESKTTVKKPSEELEAPTVSDISTTTVQTTAQPSTTIKEEVYTVTPTSDVFTSPESDKTSDFNWPTTFEYWQSTVIDPITLNDGLSPSAQEQGVSQIARQTNAWAQNTLTTPATETKTSEQAVSSSVFYESTTPRNVKEERAGKLVKDPTSTEPAQDITTIADTVVEKAKEIMGGMNATTTEKLMNVMKKTKSKTVRRLILLLVQTCDDDHNTTAEASKKALLEALMAVSQKDMDEITKEESAEDLSTTVADIEVKNYKRSDKVAALEEIRPKQFERRGKSINFDPSAINSLSSPSTTTTENIKTTTEFYTETTQAPRTTTTSRRGVKKFLVRTTPVEQKTTKSPVVDNPIAEARVAPPNEGPKTPADTRALELLRSLYTIAARWG